MLLQVSSGEVVGLVVVTPEEGRVEEGEENAFLLLYPLEVFLRLALAVGEEEEEEGNTVPCGKAGRLSSLPSSP